MLSGLTVPLKGGIVLDMKRMNSIIEINEKSHYAVVEAGTSQGMLDAYLRKHHPGLKHSLPDAPPSATIAGNIAIHGSGHLSQSEGGFHSEMVTGLEVVLPTGELARFGSCSTVPSWFSRAPLPDLVGLFLGWNGTTGVITKVGIKLYPRPKIHDVMVFMTEDIDLAPEIITRVINTEVAEDINYALAPKPDYLNGFQMTVINVTANSGPEMKMKKQIIRDALHDFYETKEAGFMPVPPNMKAGFLEAPQKALSKFADVRKGGGFEYVGAIMPIEKIPDACRAGMEITARNLAEGISPRAPNAPVILACRLDRAVAMLQERMKIERGKGLASLPSLGSVSLRQVDDDELHVRTVVQEWRRVATGVVVVQDDQDHPEPQARSAVRVDDVVPDREVHRAGRRPDGVRRPVEVRLAEAHVLRVADDALGHRSVQVPVDVHQIRRVVAEVPDEREIVRAGVPGDRGEVDPRTVPGVQQGLLQVPEVDGL